MDPSTQKMLAMQAEMARFESEISSPVLRPPLPRLTPDISLQFIPHALHHRPPIGSAFAPPPPPPPLQASRAPIPPMPPRLLAPIPPATMFNRMPRMPTLPPSVQAASAIIEAPPTKYVPSELPKNTVGIAPAVFQDFDSSQLCATFSIIPPPPPPLTHMTAAQAQQQKAKAEALKKLAADASSSGASASKLAPKHYIRTAGGEKWKDDTLLEWDPSDYRVFCGDLGNEVSDELLAKAFRKYSSFQKAKVIRDKRTNKTKGYGFVSFKDPQDFIRALREMDGKYVGNRPIKLRKSAWKERNLKAVKKKEKEKKKLGLKL